MTSKLKKYWGILVVMIVIPLGSIFVDFEILDTPFYNPNMPSPLLSSETRVVQEFLVRGDLKRISIKLSNYGQKLKGKLNLKILDSHNRKIAICQYDASRIVDNKFNDFSFKRKIKKGKYKLVIRYFPENQNEKLSVWMTATNQYPWGRLYINYQQTIGDIVFRVFYRANLIRSLSVFAKRFHFFDKKLIFIILILYGIVLFILLFFIMRKNLHA